MCPYISRVFVFVSEIFWIIKKTMKKPKILTSNFHFLLGFTFQLIYLRLDRFLLELLSSSVGVNCLLYAMVFLFQSIPVFGNFIQVEVGDKCSPHSTEQEFILSFCVYKQHFFYNDWYLCWFLLPCIENFELSMKIAEKYSIQSVIVLITIIFHTI